MPHSCASLKLQQSQLRDNAWKLLRKLYSKNRQHHNSRVRIEPSGCSARVSVLSRSVTSLVQSSVSPPRCPPPRLDTIHAVAVSSSHSSEAYMRGTEAGEKFSCHFLHIWISFTLRSSGCVISTAYCTIECAAEGLLPRWSVNPVISGELSELACYSNPSPFCACLELRVENCRVFFFLRDVGGRGSHE